MEEQKQRTFVFVTNVPTLVPAKAVAKALKDHTANIMRVEVLRSHDTLPPHENDGFALALYDSEAAALEAQRTVVSLPDGAEGLATLKLRAMQRPPPRRLEAVYSDTIEVEGEAVPKAALAESRGLQDVLSSTAGMGHAVVSTLQHRNVAPRWCVHTRERRDCPRGVACRFLHRREFQTTTKRRRETEDHEASPAEAAVSAAPAAALARLVPEQHRVHGEVLELTPAEAASLEAGRPDCDVLAARLTAAIARYPDGAVVRLDAIGGVPRDAALLRPEEVHRELGPPADLATPVLRDGYLQRALGVAQRRLSVHTAQEATDMLRRSPKVQDALLTLRSAQCPVRLVVQPFLDGVAVPHGTVRVLLDGGGVHCCLQREADVQASLVLKGWDAATDLATRNGAAVGAMSAAVTAALAPLAAEVQAHLASLDVADRPARLCLNVALRGLDAVAAAAMAGTAPPPATAAVVSVHRFEAAAQSSLMAQQRSPVPTEVRWRDRQAVYTQFLPAVLQGVLRV